MDEWKKKINKFDLASIKEDSPNGYILEVHLEYPSELHNIHNEYPLAPENLKINKHMLSRYCSDIADKFRIKNGEANKLVPNLGNKKICHPLQKSSIVLIITNESD